MRIFAEMGFKLGQRKKTIILFIILAILLLVSVLMCYFFIPRSLTRIVPTESIVSIYYEYDDLDEAKQVLLTVQGHQELRDDLSKMKYQPKYGIPDKSVPYRWLCISYYDGTIIKIDGRRVKKNKDGMLNIYRINLIGNGNLFRFFPNVV